MAGVITKATEIVVTEACSCICNKVNHICQLNQNLEALEKAMIKLKAKRDDVLGRVKMDEDTGLQRFNEVREWLASVGTIESEVDKMRTACTTQGLSFIRVCSKKLETRVRYGKKVFLMLEDVEELILTGKFDAVTGQRTRDVAEERPLQSVVGQDTILEQAWNRLMDDESKIVGILGTGGVGKTTLLCQINNNFCDRNDGVDVVIWVVVSKNATIRKIQEGIGKKLSLSGKEWDEKNEDERALDIYNILKSKKFVLLLDDIWEKVILNVVGVPYPDRENGCKVAFTTRSPNVCERMGVSDPIEVKCLDPEKAWDLFKEKIGENTLKGHPDIPKVARKVAGECRGLPLVLNAIGEIMASRSTIQEWHHADDVLTTSASEFTDMVEQILPIFKYSYDSLKGERNLTALDLAMKDLKTMRADLRQRVQLAEEKGLQRLHQIKVWLKKVETVISQHNELCETRNVELQRSCSYGASSENLGLGYIYGKRVFNMLNIVEDLKSSGVFEEVAYPATRAMGEERPVQAIIVGQESILEKAWNHLMDDGTNIMGLYGMGGVGKTTLLTQINNRFVDLCEEDDGVDIVIYVVVSGDLQIRKIQKEIGEIIGYEGVEWNQKGEDKKKVDIFKFLNRKRFVLLLDDIWSKVELTEIGIPNPTNENGCKIAFTTRCQAVCASMGVHDAIEIRCLGTHDAWDLFKKKVGHITPKTHPDITKIAKELVKHCCGLPLALNVIGETMASKKTTQEWNHAVGVLKTYAADFDDVEEKILPILKYSYDNLESDRVKSCFQYCSMFSKDTLIEKERLIDYWICEGFIDGHKSKEEAVNQGYMILGTLVRASLLLEGGKYNNKSYVKMHDVIHDMALWIASDLGKHKGNYIIVRAGVRLNEIKDWKVVKKMSLADSRIEEIHGNPKCPNLTTLFLQDNHLLVSISGEFFRSMPRLVVLDLSWNVKLSGLPEEISKLVSLQYLDLSETNIGRLPVGLQKLKKLMHLNLESMLNLEGVTGISKLSSLKTLRLLNFLMWLTTSLLEELKSLEHLEVLTIEITSSSALEQVLSSHKLVSCIQKISIKFLEFLDEESAGILSLPTIGNLREVFIAACGMREIQIERSTSLTSPCFPHLSKVLIAGCDELTDLTWLLFAPNLTHLNVWNSSKVEEIISREKASTILEGGEADIVPFRKLEYIHLWDLPELQSIYWIPLPFPSLSKINVQTNCQKLRKLPLNSQSCTAGEELVIEYGDEEWKEKVEWEDEATRLRFLPSCKLVLYNQ